MALPETTERLRRLTLMLGAAGFVAIAIAATLPAGRAGGIRLTFALGGDLSTDRASPERAIALLKRRAADLKGADVEVRPDPTTAGRVVVDLRGRIDVGEAKAFLMASSHFEFRLVEAGPEVDRATLLGPWAGVVPPDREIVAAAPAEPASPPSLFVVQGQSVVTGEDVGTAKAVLDQGNKPAVDVTFSADGKTRMATVTAANVGRKLAIMIDHRVTSAPVISEAVTGKAQITGAFTREEAARLARQLRAGEFLVPPTLLEEQQIAPIEGAQSARVIALCIALVLGGAVLVVLTISLF